MLELIYPGPRRLVTQFIALIDKNDQALTQRAVHPVLAFMTSLNNSWQPGATGDRTESSPYDVLNPALCVCTAILMGEQLQPLGTGLSLV